MSDQPTSSAGDITIQWTQTTAFPDLAPEVHGEAAVSPAEGSEGEVVPRTPGWRLVASGGRTRGFHRIQSVGVLGEIRTLCGLKGRTIDESERVFTPCATCQAESPDAP